MEFNQFRKAFFEKRNNVYIIKPEASSQGKGIFLVKDPSEIEAKEHQVAQEYLNAPFLVDGLKFDLRIYVLLTGVNPLRIYMFEDGLVRFATEPYKPAKRDNIDNLFMHLTNYAINKKSSNYVQNNTDENYDESAHKRSLKSLYELLTKSGYDVKKLKIKIEDIVVKTIITSQPSLSHIYKSCQPEDVENQHCF